MTSQLERDDPQSQEEPVSGERITLRFFPPPMELLTPIPADARDGEIESSSTSEQGEISPQANADDTPIVTLGGHAGPAAEDNEPQCCAPPAAGDVESTQSPDPVSSPRVEATSSPSSAAPEPLAPAAPQRAPVARLPLVAVSILSLLMGSAGSFGTWIALRKLHPEHANATHSQPAESLLAPAAPNELGVVGVAQAPTTDLKAEARGLETAPSQSADTGQVPPSIPTDRRDAPASVSRRQWTPRKARSSRAHANEPEPGTPVDQIFVNSGGELVNAQDQPLKARLPDVPAVSTSDEWIPRAQKDAGH